MGILKKLINSLYNVRMKLSRVTGIGIDVSSNEKDLDPPQSFYDLSATQSNGQQVNFNEFRGKKVVIVNLASECGFTPQYEELEELYRLHEENLVVLGFPSNDFGGQEPASDEEIRNFCKINFGVTFPLFRKDHVKGNNKQPVYQWLTDAGKNGWNNEEPSWNFYKYLVDSHGRLNKMFSSSVAPSDIISA